MLRFLALVVLTPMALAALVSPSFVPRHWFPLLFAQSLLIAALLAGEVLSSLEMYGWGTLPQLILACCAAV